MRELEDASNAVMRAIEDHGEHSVETLQALAAHGRVLQKMLEANKAAVEAMPLADKLDHFDAVQRYTTRTRKIPPVDGGDSLQ